MVRFSVMYAGGVYPRFISRRCDEEYFIACALARSQSRFRCTLGSVWYVLVRMFMRCGWTVHRLLHSFLHTAPLSLFVPRFLVQISTFTYIRAWRGACVVALKPVNGLCGVLVFVYLRWCTATRARAQDEPLGAWNCVCESLK